MIGIEKAKEEIKRQLDKFNLNYAYYENSEMFMFLSATRARISMACIEIYPEDWGYTVQTEIPLFIENDKMDDVSEFIYRYKSRGFELSYKHSRVFYRRTTFCEGGNNNFLIELDLDLMYVADFSDRLIDILYSDVTPQQAVDRESYSIKKTKYEGKHDFNIILDKNDGDNIGADKKDICNSIKEYLDGENLSYSIKLDNEDWFNVECNIKNIFNKIDLKILAGTWGYCIWSELPVMVKETALKETAKLLNILNRELSSRFEWDYSDNSIYCNSYNVYCGGPLSKDFIEMTLHCVIDPVEEYGDIINAVANGECTAEEAIERIEQEDEE